MFLRAAVPSAAVLLLSVHVVADRALAEAKKPPVDVSIQSYGDHDKTCQVWTDSCRRCRRGENDAPICGNIGIACQPNTIVCDERKSMDSGGKSGAKSAPADKPVPKDTPKGK